MNMPAESSEPLVLADYNEEGICFLTLNRPRAYNAMSLALMEEMIETLSDVAANPSVKVVVLSGSGKGFCAGHDLKEMRSHTGDRGFIERTFATCSRMMLAIVRLPQPVIAKVRGIATAAGCQLVASCDLAIAEEGARFATPGVNIGLFCSTPMVALSRNVATKHAMEMLLFGEMVPARRAAEIGLVNRVLPEVDLDAAAEELAMKIIGKSPYTLKVGKRAFYEQIPMDLDAAYEHCGRVMTENMMARDAQEGIDAFLEKRPAVWRGC